MAPRSHTHGEVATKIGRALETAGTGLKTVSDASVFRDREDISKLEESQKVEKALRDLFAESMKHNKKVFKSEVLDEDKPKKKLKKADSQDNDDNEVPYLGAGKEDDDSIVRSEDGLTPNENNAEAAVEEQEEQGDDGDLF